MGYRDRAGLAADLADRSQFEIGLTITYPSDELASHFLERLPKDVKVHVLAPEAWLSHCRQLKKKRKLGPLGKIYEELLLPPVRKPVLNRRFRKILAGLDDLVVDYDMSVSRLTGQAARADDGLPAFSAWRTSRAGMAASSASCGGSAASTTTPWSYSTTACCAMRRR